MRQRPKNLAEAVEIRGPADELIEAALPPHAAHREGTLDGALGVIRRHPKVTESDVWTACIAGELDRARALLDRDPSLAVRPGGPRAWPPLLYLCFSRFLLHDPERAARMVEIAALLLERGADPNCHWIDPAEGPGNRETPLYGAAGIANNVALTRLLVGAGADPNDGETAYHMVEHDGVPCAPIVWPGLAPIQRGAALGHKLDYDDLEGLGVLLRLGADPNGVTPFRNRALHQAVFRCRALPFFDLLFEFGADPNLVNGAGKTAYAMAARAGNTTIMARLVAAGAHTALDATDSFLAACAAGDTARVKAVLAADPGLPGRLDAADRNQICEVASAGNTVGVRTMLDAGWDVNTRGGIWGETPLHRAAIEGHLETARLLYESGADLTIRDNSYGSSPVGWAAHGGHRDVAALLASDPRRLDLLDAAEWGHDARALELLGDRDPDRAIADREPGVLLRVAAHFGREDLVRALLHRGADPTLRNSDGLSAADVAAARGHVSVRRLLERSD